MLLKELAQQPVAIIADLSGLSAAQPAALTVVCAAARQASLWPGVPLLVCAPPGQVADDLRRLGFDRSVPVRPSLAQAHADAHGTKAVPTVRELLPPLPGAQRRARTVAADVCARWGLADVSDQVLLVVSELVDNAVRHAGTTIGLRLSRRGRYLLVSVEDGSPREPVLPAAPPQLTVDAPRGLFLVEHTADRWGSMPTATGGKVVWAVFHVSG